jgi:hypothetical protein
MKYWMFSIFLTFYPQKKAAPPLIRVEKKFSSKLGIQGIKRNRILRWFQKHAKVSSLAKEKKKITEFTEFLRTWKILQKMIFLRKNLLDFLDARVLHIFEISAKFRFFWYPLHPVSKNFFFNSYKGQCCFFKLKGQIRFNSIL